MGLDIYIYMYIYAWYTMYVHIATKHWTTNGLPTSEGDAPFQVPHRQAMKIPMNVFWRRGEWRAADPPVVLFLKAPEL